jgi:aromatic-amino-acid transaminase
LFFSQYALTSFTLLNKEGGFNKEAFDAKVNGLLAKQDSLVILLNTPAHNPTGYSLTLSDWDKVIEILSSAGSDKK